jgi:peptidoglycan-associated lipoprotein
MFMFSTRKLTLIWMAVMLAVFAAGCKKKVPPPPPPPPPQAAAPETPPPPAPGAPRIAQFSAEPTSIQRGQSSTLRWEVTGQTNSIAINNGIGAVMATGNRQVSPNGSTTYTLTANGPGGTTTASATVNVAEPPPPPPPTRTTTPQVTLDQRLSSDVQDAFFDYDKSDIRSDARDALTRNAAALRSILADFPTASIVIEGHCDERGSAEYNLGLGDRRSTSAKDFLVQLGVPADRLKTISYGKERPQCTEANEACWQENRRAHFAPAQ